MHQTWQSRSILTKRDSILNIPNIQVCHIFILSAAAYGPWYTHVKQYWERHKNSKNVLFLHFEDLKKVRWPCDSYEKLSQNYQNMIINKWCGLILRFIWGRPHFYIPLQVTGYTHFAFSASVLLFNQQLSHHSSYTLIWKLNNRKPHSKKWKNYLWF